MRKQRLIINADDYGMSPLFNKGILELAKKGLVTSISIMINRAFVSSSDFEKLPQISTGLHLELTDTDKNIEAELENQINLFREKFKRLPTHLDGHQHCHLLEDNLPRAIKIAKKYNLPMRSRGAKVRKIIKDARIKTPDIFVDWHPKRTVLLFETLRNTNQPCIELVCHPGYYDKNSTYPYNESREEELEILKSSRFKKILSPYELINYKDIQNTLNKR